MNMSDKKYNHTTDADRLQIEHMLRNGEPLARIAEKVGKHHSTVAREIRKRSAASGKGAYGRVTNRCAKRRECGRAQLCMDRPGCTRRCCFCHRCNARCPEFREEKCARLAAPPYVCNGCKDELRCVLRKMYYIHSAAHGHYRNLLAKSREGANVTEAELAGMDALLSPLVRGRGQSVHHAVANNPDSFTVNEKTVYRYVAGGLLPGVKDGDMPRVCMLRPRKKKPVEHKVDTKCRAGRTYADFEAFVAANPGMRVVEMDTVIGRVGGKALLTLHWRDSALMLAILRDRNDSRSVIDAFARLREIAGGGGTPPLGRLFPVLLTDNGSEFSNPRAIEGGTDADPECRLFYCDPRAAYQKPHVERNHELLRLILPPGASFDALDQERIDLAMSHVNSYSRPVLNDKSPHDLFAATYGEGTLARLGQRRIPANDITLKPSLLG